MGYWTNLRIRAMDFWKRNRKKILIAIIIWLVIIIINYIIKNMPEKISAPSTTYTPHVTVLNSEEVPEKYQEPIQNLVDTYFNYCNNKEYEKAYNLITEDCRKKMYPTLEQFTGYVNEVFEGKQKIYNIQSYSIVDNKYIYNIRILDDILANGTTDGYYYYEEKLILIEENGEMKLSIGEYIGEENPEVSIEDDYMEIKIVNKTVEYDTETYTIQFRNKTDKCIVILDNKQNNEVVLDLGGKSRQPINFAGSRIVLYPNTMTTKEIVFSKYYDDGSTAQKIKFGAIRVLTNYNDQVGTTQEDLDNAVKLYGLEVEL